MLVVPSQTAIVDQKSEKKGALPWVYQKYPEINWLNSSFSTFCRKKRWLSQGYPWFPTSPPRYAATWRAPSCSDGSNSSRVTSGTPSRPPWRFVWLGKYEQSTVLVGGVSQSFSEFYRITLYKWWSFQIFSTCEIWSNDIWLVVEPTPLKNMSASVMMKFPMEK